MTELKDTLMEQLSQKERLGVLYFAGISALKEKIEDNEKLLYRLAKREEEGAIFATLFFLFVILAGNDTQVKNTLLACKEDEMREKGLKEEEIDEYISIFNSRMKELARLYLDVNERVSDDDSFHREIIKEFSSYLMDALKIEKTEDSYKQLGNIFMYALKIASECIDIEKEVKKEEKAMIEEKKED